MSFIVSQNKNIPGIRRSIALLCERCGERRLDRQGRAYFAFPSPAAVAALSEAELAACRLGYRCRYVHEAALAMLRGALDPARLRDAEEEAAMHALMAVPGVGIKVASCVSLFGLHNLNAFPRDVWIKRILAEQFPNGYPFERYAPYNGVFQQYMFAYYRKARG